MKSTKTETIAAQIGKALAGRIIGGDLAPGERLRQDHIAAEFGASHVPVREAFRLLEAQGLAVSEPRRGVRVAGFTCEQVREVAEMRAALEVVALRHAIPHLTPSLLEKAEETNKAGDRARDIHDWEEANRAFHHILLTPCGMPRLLKEIDDLHAASSRFLFSGWRAAWDLPTAHDHRTILGLLRAGQGEAATNALMRHVQTIKQKRSD